jgi:DMSO reductase family type II enzyme heme b subunit
MSDPQVQAQIQTPQPQGDDPDLAPQSRMTRREMIAVLAAGAATMTAVGGLVSQLARDSDPVEADVRARFRDGPLPDDPVDDAWRAPSPVKVPVFAQQMTTPRLEQGTVDEVELRVLHNGHDIAFRLEWHDDELDDLEAMGRFRDSVAVQLPIGRDGGTPVTMGGPGKPVHILHWKASWQRQVANGPRTVRDVFPNAVNELTPETLLGEEAARVVYPALYVGNLAAARERVSAVEELVAEGFGTLTTHDQQRAVGTGTLRDGRWHVVIRAPMTGGRRHARMTPGATTEVAVAAWDGGPGQRGGRKHWSNWLSMFVEPAG